MTNPTATATHAAIEAQRTAFFAGKAARESTEPVLHYGVPFAEYLRWENWSQSTLKLCRRSMKHVKAAYDGERAMKVTDAMLLGSALHCAFLEPELVLERVVEWTGPRRAGKEWESFQAEHDGKIILTPGMYANLQGMIRSLRAHPVVRQWSGQLDAVEVSATAVLHGLPVKGRCDALTSDPLVDLKATKDASYDAVVRTVMSFGYHVQAAMYRALFKRERYVLIFVENLAPFDCCAYELSPQLLRKGEDDLQSYCRRTVECITYGEWPGLGDDIVQLELPEYAATSNIDWGDDEHDG